MAKAKTKTKKPIIIHRSHSFKLRPHVHTSYPLLGLLVFATLLFCWSFTGGVNGVDYQVKGRIPAPMLTSAATIDSPLGGATFESPKIDASGTCPDKSYVTLTNNGHTVGTAQCQPDGRWQISLTLRYGQNVLSAQAYNLTDDAGPAGTPTTVIYKPPYTPPEPSTNTPPAPSTATTQTPPAPSVITAQPSNKNAPVIGFTFSFKAYNVGQTTDWPLTLSGGTPPYAIKVDWGDGAGNLQSQATPGDFHLQHVYDKPATHRTGYPIMITVADAAGQTTSLQITVMIVPTGVAATTGIANSPGSNWPNIPLPSGEFWRYAAPAYATIILGVSMFWLGERYAMQQVALQTVKVVKHRRARP